MLTSRESREFIGNLLNNLNESTEIKKTPKHLKEGRSHSINKAKRELQRARDDHYNAVYNSIEKIPDIDSVDDEMLDNMDSAEALEALDKEEKAHDRLKAARKRYDELKGKGTSIRAEKGTDRIGKDKRDESAVNEAPVSYMEPEYDSRASFYKKAKVDTGDNDNENKLYSYGTLVAEMKDGKPVVYGTYSQTTLRHIKEWLKQNGFKAENSKQIMADYGVKEEGCIKENEEETPKCSVCGKELTDGQKDAGVCDNCINKENKTNESTIKETDELTEDEYGTNAIDEFNGYSLYKSSQAADVDGQSYGKYLVKDSNGNGVRSFISQNDMKAKTKFRNQ